MLNMREIYCAIKSRRPSDSIPRKKLIELPVQILKNICDRLRSYLFQEACRLCTCLVNRDSPAFTVCGECWNKLCSIRPEIEIRQIGSTYLMPVHSAVKYDEAMRLLIYKLKYDGDRLIACDLARLLLAAYQEICQHYESTQAHNAEFSPPQLIPIPLSRWKQIQRGFNQAELIARELGKLGGAEIQGWILTRRKHTKAQHELSKSERRENLKNAFHCMRYVKARSKRYPIIIIDDIFTSGATLCEAAATLYRAGYRDIYSLTVARAILINTKILTELEPRIETRVETRSNAER